MRTYRAAVIGLGWMGMLYDIAERSSGPRYRLEDTDRPLPEVDVHRRFHHHDHPGEEGQPITYCEAMWDRPEVDLIAAADRDAKRLEVFTRRYGIESTYTAAAEMLAKEKPEIVAVTTNVAGRADLTCQAVDCGALAVMTEKPMVHRLEEADRMVQRCAAAGVPLCAGQISTIHPSFDRARRLLDDGAIGDLLSIETPSPCSQHQNWSMFLDAPIAWVAGTGDRPRRESGSDEFVGSGIAVARDGLVIHFRCGAMDAGVRLTGTAGEMLFRPKEGWRLWQDLATLAGRRRVPVPWPAPQFHAYGPAYCLADLLDCLAGKRREPKNSGRHVATALEVEIALKLSSERGGQKVDLPVPDRSLGLNYDWFR